ncbi:hypothetical protein KHA90_24950 [Flavobacterium psychroterrae]|uniref:Uncharacterized protein n=1 Tax=Flavobacterium psychroterrae TaxID=2133767 RepID=A0ABS5PIW1_9FLAO|nr:hypothetical protein [Flavobacterium psychroterrae]MBS7234249.1 hypothetical protein [Flavobacterium psychroterrae]
MSIKSVLEHYLEKFETNGTTLTDISFDNLPFLVEKEPVYNMKGQKVSKSYFCQQGKEVVRIKYDRVIGTYNYNGVDYENVFIGLQKSILYMDWSGAISHVKNKQFYSFNLEPVYLADGTETIKGFSSQKQRQILKSERFSADDYLSSKNPDLHSALYDAYQSEYNAYLRTGISTSFVNAMNSETNTELLAMLNKEVFEYEPMTVKELIILNLQ